MRAGKMFLILIDIHFQSSVIFSRNLQFVNWFSTLHLPYKPLLESLPGRMVRYAKKDIKTLFCIIEYPTYMENKISNYLFFLSFTFSNLINA